MADQIRIRITMPTAPDNHEAHDYAECISKRLPR
jgi:hypothetical protein